MKIGYGLIGLGGIARTHLQGLKCLPILGTPVPALEYAALLTTDPGKEKLAKDLGFARVEQDLDEFLALDQVDVVDICTPNYLHRDQVLAAARRGKHVYFEKPLCLNGEEAGKLERELANSDRVIQGAYVLRFLPALARARALLARGAIGPVHSFRFSLYHSSYLNPQRPGSWRLRHALSGGGALMDLGCHLLDSVRFLLGEAASVQAWTHTVVKKRPWPQGEAPVDVDDHALVVLELENGARGTVEVSRVAVGNEGTHLEVYGEKGALHLDPGLAFPRCFDALGREFFPEVTPDPFLTQLLAVFPPAKLSLGWMVDAHAASLACFLRGAAGEKVVPGTPTLHEGVKTQLLLEMAYKSAGEKIDIL